MKIRLKFLGAARNVTGSCYLLDLGGERILVDCGLFQERAFAGRNWSPFAVPPSSLAAVVLTHAHLDHCGLLPRLVREGFSGCVHCTPATADIVKRVLMDSAHVQEEDAAFKRKRHEREGRAGPYPEVPLYTPEDAQACLPLLRTHAYGETFVEGRDVQISLHEAGHILGSAFARFVTRESTPRTLVLSGDIGRWNAPILRDPEGIGPAQYVVVESTYGDRTHKSMDEIPERLARVVNRACEAGGNVVIPSFAIERTQDLLYHLGRLLRENRIPPMPVFVDSPMAVSVTEIFRRHLELFDAETARMIRSGTHPCDFPGLRLCRSVEESKAINEVRGAAIIIAGSGMCTGGRIKHHLAHNLGRPESTVLFVGYQASGTLGRLLIEGARTVRILGEPRPVKAGIEKINGFSAHADREELHRWLSGVQGEPRHVYVTHGEPDTANAFGGWLTQRTGWPSSVPEYQQEVSLA